MVRAGFVSLSPSPMVPLEPPYHKLPSVVTLKNLYYDNHLSLKQIADKFGSSDIAVRLKLTRAGFVLRTLSEGQDLVANHVDLTTSLIELLDGLLLGDGSIFDANYKIPRYRKSAFYRHTDKHQEYIDLLHLDLSVHGLDSRIDKVKRITKAGLLVTYPNLVSLSYRELSSVRERWYPKGKKLVPQNLQLTPVILRNWYIGDGSFKEGKNHTKKSECLLLCIYFDDRGISLLSSELLTLGIENNIVPQGIYIRSKSRQRFFDYILSDNPKIPNCYLYKFPERYCYA